MIQLSPRGKILYQFLNLTVVLLLLYSVGFSLSALSLLPAGQLTGLFSAAASQEFRTQIFQLLCLTGFISAGLMMAGESLSDREAARALRAWSAFVALAAVLSPLELGQLLDGITALALLFILLWCRRADGSSFMRVWRLSLLLIALSLPAGHIAPSAVGPALDAFQRQAAFALGALSMVFWLMPRFSVGGREKALESLPIAALFLLLGGSLISLGRMPLPALIGLGAAPLVVLSYIILAGHVARSLRERHENASLATHWIALAALCWLAGAGILGALLIQSGIAEALGGTDISAAQDWLGEWFIAAVVLAFINEAATSLRGDNRRVTGYLPLWLIAFGVGASFIAQLCRGVAQFYLREFGADTAFSEAELLLPITIVWLIGLLVAAAGIVVYALGYFARRPAIRLVEP